MIHASDTATAFMALMRLRGVGRRGALKLLSVPPKEASDYRGFLFERAERARYPTDDLSDAWTRAEAQLAESALAGVKAFSVHDEGYPDRLRNMPDPPAVLFVKGDPKGLHAPAAIAIVGTREPTPYGEKVAPRMAEIAVREGFVIVSGLAHGCDTLGHRGCVAAQGIGVAVLAHGLDRVYPAANRGLAEQLLDGGGCLVSEYPLGVTPMRTAFAERDRIQSGLSDGVLVIETDVKGGTMHTVRFARDQGRPLACLEHPEKWRVEEKTRGNQMLIHERRATPIPDGEALQSFLHSTKPSLHHDEPIMELDKADTEAQQAWTF